jgi:hypothetical protein
MSGLQSQGDYLHRALDRATDPYAIALDTTLYSGQPFLQGLMQSNDDLVQQALTMQEQVIRDYPVLGNFSSATILSRAPRTSQYFSLGLERYFRFIELCTGTTIDRAHPDVRGMLHGTSVDLLCQNNTNVPHLVQGSLFLFADLLVKNGQIDAAPDVYRAIRESEGFDTWRFRDQVDVRLNSDLAARATEYEQSTDVFHQPALGASPCLACHQD